MTSPASSLAGPDCPAPPGEGDTRSGGRTAFGLVAAVLAMIVVLWLMGRRWWCACGAWAPWSGDASGAHNSQHLLDPYSLTHLLHGVGFWLIFQTVWPRMRTSSRLIASAVLEALWEILENSPAIIDRYRAATAAKGYVGDSIGNSIGDLVACLAGTWLAARLGFGRSLILFAATEVVTILWFRDSLLINILMLLWPIEAIKTWQLR